MKITAVTGYPLEIGGRGILVVTVETDAGITGLGEGGISGREMAMLGMLEHYARFLLGMDPRRIEHIWQTLYRSQYYEGGKIAGGVISAIDVALWDILAQSLGVPVYQLLGGACRERVQCFANVSIGEPGLLTGPACVEQSVALVAAGWRYLRLRPGMPGPDWNVRDGAVYEPLESVELAAHWIREVRRAVGPGIGLSIDFHHRLSVAEAAMFCAKVQDVNLLFLEEPIRAQSPSAYQQLRRMTPVPFAIGEEFANKWEFLPYIEGGILNFARVDVCIVGGFSEARKVAGWCEAHYIDLMPHNPLGPIATAASVHFSAATSNVAQLEYLPEIAARYPEDLFPVMPRIQGDSFPLPTAPGLGVTFNAAAAARYPYQWREPPHFRRADGAHTNW